MSTAPDDVRYASVDAVLTAATDSDPSSAQQWERDRAKRRAAAATETWINQTGKAFHEVRVGNPSDPRTWPVFDVHDAISWSPATVILDEQPLPIDAAQSDAVEVRDGRDSWDDITSEEGDEWTLDYRRKRLRIHRRRFSRKPWDNPNTRFCRLTYRYGPIDEDVTITDGLVENVPNDVAEAVAARAAMRLTLDDNAQRGVPDNGQQTSRGSKRAALKEEWEETVADYTGFSTL
ncbi:hypothetical protein C453_12956 [Haloferax elongans ATCC BAA-1513]|uniref:Uncharacterized protein n=1 Tax=Haloferax elongans ATCC BAA-1513 TaxID=1230453 RepID=M0HIY7_HALEO|nr:hypothetical protein [Haloferax elongans]ELZ84456.1 hypothetical protein C453_12956 [Haloferax elongans ATCC BAA-1513]